MLLDQQKINATIPTAKVQTLNDGGGLYLDVKPRRKNQTDNVCAMYWVHQFSFMGKPHRRGLGAYGDKRRPLIGLEGYRNPLTQQWVPGARDLAETNRRLLEQGILPPTRLKRRSPASAEDGTIGEGPEQVHMFEQVAREWHSEHCTTRRVCTKHVSDTMTRLEDHVFTHDLFLKTPLNDIVAPKLGKFLTDLHPRLRNASIDKVASVLSKVFKYALGMKMITSNPAELMLDWYEPTSTEDRNHAAITEAPLVGKMIHAIRSFGRPGDKQDLIVKVLLQLTALTMVRSQEISEAEWSEVDFGSRTWTIPGIRMKRRVRFKARPHVVYLSRQAIQLLRELHVQTGQGKFLFPAQRNTMKPIHNKGANQGLRKCGIPSEEMTSHGFRATGETSLLELGADQRWIDLSLDHASKNPLKKSYDRAVYAAARREVMQVLADYYDHLADGGDQLTFHPGWTRGHDALCARGA